MGHTRIALVAIGLLLWPVVSDAQFGEVVFDPQNFLRNTATAIATAEMVRRQIEDLRMLEDFAEYAETIQRVLAFSQTASQLSVRLLSRYSRWTALLPGQDHIPCTVALLARWSEVYDRDTEESILDGGVAQTLLAHSVGILESVGGVLNLARGITGTTSGLQNLHTLLADLVALMAGATTARAPMDEKDARKDMRTLVQAKSARILAGNRLAGLTGTARRTCDLLAGI